jgi:vacuolar-type H+-ATPase subunit I/STV1
MSEENTGATTPETPEQTTQAPSLLTALVGETQKYKTAEDLAKAYSHAEEFINKLKDENASLREQANKAKSLDEVLAKISERPSEPVDQPAISQESIAEIVQKQISGLEAAKTRQSNLEKADKAMKEKFGEKAVEVFNQTASTPELREVFTKLASVDPDKFVSMFGAPATGGNSVDVSTVNTTSALNATPRVSEWSKDWVTNVRRTDPRRYWSSDFQWQLAQNTSKYFKA